MNHFYCWDVGDVIDADVAAAAAVVVVEDGVGGVVDGVVDVVIAVVVAQAEVV